MTEIMEGWGEHPSTPPRINPHGARIERLEELHSDLRVFWRKANGKTATEAMKSIAHIGAAIDELKAYEVE